MTHQGDTLSGFAANSVHKEVIQFERFYDMKTKTNPHTAPATKETTSQDSIRKVERPIVEFGGVIRTWERLRIGYNLVLIVFTMMLTAGLYRENLADILFWFAVGLGAIVANLCFMIAPAIEGYGRHFGLWHKPMTWLLFLGGLALTAILAWDCIANYHQLLEAN